MGRQIHQNDCIAKIYKNHGEKKLNKEKIKKGLKKGINERAEYK